ASTMRTLLALILLTSTSGAWSLCKLNLQSPYPIVGKVFGSKTAILKRPLSEIELAYNETATFYCPLGLKIGGSNSGYGNQKTTKVNFQTAELTCGDDGVYLDQQRIIEQTTSGYISCNADSGSTLYESNVSLVGCDADEAMTLVIGNKLRLSEIKLLALCYDLSASRLHFVKFLAYPAKNLLLGATTADQVLGELQLSNVISGLDKYFSYVTKGQFESLRERQPHLGELYEAQLFDFDSLLQDQQQMKQLEKHKHLLNIVWLRALRRGNWKHWLEALRELNNESDDRFDVRIGVSGLATLPLAQRCNASRSLQLIDSDSGNTLHVPAYVWAHVLSLEPTGSASDEFVLVAHNSPFVNVVEMSSFCDDMCSEIPWLSKSLFGELHLVPKFGVVHCCRVDQVDKLTDF
ncbi:hypothetical protein KR093_003765, partial [Drosophila rubida]